MRSQTCLAGGQGIELCLLRKIAADGTSERVLLWGFDSVYFYNSHTGRPARKMSDYKAPVGGLSPGTYKVEFWNAETGVVSSRTTLTVNQGQTIIDLPIPPFERDFAIKLIRK